MYEALAKKLQEVTRALSLRAEEIEESVSLEQVKDLLADANSIKSMLEDMLYEKIEEQQQTDRR